MYQGKDEWSERFVSGTGEWSGNLFDFFTEVNSRLFVKAPKPFRLDGAVRMTITNSSRRRGSWS